MQAFIDGLIVFGLAFGYMIVSISKTIALIFISLYPLWILSGLGYILAHFIYKYW